jgi:hypothetical protein
VGNLPSYSYFMTYGSLQVTATIKVPSNGRV